MEVTYEIYNDDKNQFFEKHGWDFESHTSSMSGDGVYGKTYVFKDNSAWFERMSPVTELVTVTVHGVQIETPVKLQKVSYWTTDNSRERSYFERW